MNRPESALIIDPESHWVNTLTSLLNEIEIRDVHAVGNKTEALEELKLRRFDIVLVDVQSPEKEAIDLINEIQRFDHWSRIIVLSHISKRQVVLDCVYAGALQYILKSDDNPTILRKILTVTERTKSRPESSNKSSRTQFNSFL